MQRENLHPNETQTFFLFVLLYWPDETLVLAPKLVVRETFTSSLLLVTDKQINKHTFVLICLSCFRKSVQDWFSCKLYVSSLIDLFHNLH